MRCHHRNRVTDSILPRSVRTTAPPQIEAAPGWGSPTRRSRKERRRDPRSMTLTARSRSPALPSMPQGHDAPHGAGRSSIIDAIKPHFALAPAPPQAPAVSYFPPRGTRLRSTEIFLASSSLTPTRPRTVAACPLRTSFAFNGCGKEFYVSRRLFTSHQAAEDERRVTWMAHVNS